MMRWLTALWPWLLIVAASGYTLGVYHERNAWKARQADEIKRSRQVERAGGDIADQAEAGAIAAKDLQLEQAHATIKTLRNELKDMPRCRVPRRAVRVLDGGVAMPRSAPAAPEPAPAAAPVAPDPGAAGGVECRVVVENCGWNRVNVCEPNADQVGRLQRFYDELRTRYNQGG